MGGKTGVKGVKWKCPWDWRRRRTRA